MSAPPFACDLRHASFASETLVRHSRTSHFTSPTRSRRCTWAMQQSRLHPLCQCARTGHVERPQQRWQSEADRPFLARHVAERDSPLPRGASAASIPACGRYRGPVGAVGAGASGSTGPPFVEGGRNSRGRYGTRHGEAGRPALRPPSRIDRPGRRVLQRRCLPKAAAQTPREADLSPVALRRSC